MIPLDGADANTSTATCHEPTMALRPLQYPLNAVQSGVLISVAIPAYNEEKLLPQTLRAIRKAGCVFTDRGWKLEMVVCDNNSTDQTAEIAREFGARVVHERHNQISRARNAAGQAAQGKWIVFVDADSQPSQALFEATAEAMDNDSVIGGGCTIHMSGIPIWARFWLGTWNLTSRLMRWPAGSYIFCRAAAFRDVDGFSTEFYAGEELDFGERLKKLARKKDQHLHIISRTSLTTSPRKLDLYSPLDFARICLSTVFTGGRTLRQASTCGWWYDGRR